MGETQAKTLCLFICHKKDYCLTQAAMGYPEAKLHTSKNTLLLNCSLRSTVMQSPFIYRSQRRGLSVLPFPVLPNCLLSLGVSIFSCLPDLSSASSGHRAHLLNIYFQLQLAHWQPLQGKQLWARSGHGLATDQSKATSGPRTAHVWVGYGPLCGPFCGQVRKALTN